MSPLPALPAVLFGLVLVLAPGLSLLALLGRRRERLALDEALYLAVGLSVAGSAWLALMLAETGTFSMGGAAGLVGAACAIALLLGRRRLVWPLPRPRRWRELVPATLLLALSVVLLARPSEYIVGGRDPGAYVAAMGVIARSGGLVYTDPAVLSIPEQDVALFYRHPDNPAFSWARFMGFDLESPRSGRVFPQFFHLFPAFGAYLFRAMGEFGALSTPCVFGVLGGLGVFFTFRRLFGEQAALITALLLNLNVLHVWFGRYPVSEGMSQFLVFLGLFGFVLWEERAGKAFAVIAGAALGLALLVRIDSVLVVVPLALFLWVRRAQGALTWRDALPLLLPFGLLASHATVHGLVFAPRYVHDILTRPYWRYPPVVWALAGALALAALLAADRIGPSVVAWCAQRADRLRAALIGVLLLAALYAYFVRPLLSAWAGGDGNLPGTALQDSGWLRALHGLGFRRLAAHDAQSLVRLGWVVSPPALLLALLGLVLTLRSWQSRFLFPLLMAATISGFYFYKIRVFNDYPFAFRRFWPVTLPFLLALATLALMRLAARGGLRRAAAIVLGGAVLASYANQTRTVVDYVDWRGTVGFVRDLARRFGRQDIVIFEQPKSIHLLSLPLWATHGVHTLELARFDPDPDRLQHLVERWRHRYRNIYFAHTYNTDLCGLFLERVEPHLSFGTYEWYAYNERPALPELRSLHFSLSRVVPPGELQVPPLPEVDVGGPDDVLVSGFFGKEGGARRRYRWTGSCGSVYLPGARGASRLTITAAAEQRPDVATVSVSLAGTALGEFVTGPSWRRHTFTLPAEPLPDPLVLRLDVPSWRPANVLPGSNDIRDLGVMIDRIELDRDDTVGDGRIPPPTPGG